MSEELSRESWNYEPLTNDGMFHLVFLSNEKARRALTSVLLNIPESEINAIDVLNPMQFSDAYDAKQTVLDLRVHLNNDTFLNIEVQVRRFQEWTNRTVIYTCRQITEQSNREGFAYKDLEPVIHVAIMDHTLFEDHKRFFARYEVKDEEGYRYTDKIQFYVMDLTAIDDADDAQKERGLTDWAKAFRAKSWEEVNQIDNSGVKEAAKTMRLIMSNPTEREMIRMRQDARNDWKTTINAERRDERITTLASLVEDGYLTIDVAASRANMTKQEFSIRAGLKL